MRIFVLLCVFLGGLGQGVVNPKLPDLLTNHAHLALDTGVSASLMYLGVFLASFFYGRWADRGFTFRLLAAGLLGYALVLALFRYASARDTLFLLRFAEGLALSAMYVSADVVLCRASRDEERGQWLSYYGVALSIGLLLGPALILLGEAAGLSPAWPPILGGLSLVTVVAALVTFRFRLPPAEAAGPTEIRHRGAALSASFYGFLEAGLVAVMAAVATSYYHAKAEFIFLTLILAAAVASLFWGWLIDRLGGQRALRIIFATFAALMAAFSLVHAFADPGNALIFAGAVGFGVAAGGIYPAGFAWLIEGSHPAQYGYASGLFNRAYGFGSLLGPLCFGLAVETFGVAGFFALSAALGVAGLASASQRSKGRSVS